MGYSAVSAKWWLVIGLALLALFLIGVSLAVVGPVTVSYN
jgi:hypothetical protein